MIDMTAGELGTRGSAEERTEESANAAKMWIVLMSTKVMRLP